MYRYVYIYVYIYTYIYIYSSLLVCEIPYGYETKFAYECDCKRMRVCRAPQHATWNVETDETGSRLECLSHLDWNACLI